MFSEEKKYNIRCVFNACHSYRRTADILNIAPNSVRNVVLNKCKENKKKRGPKPKVEARDLSRIKREALRIFNADERVTARKVRENCDLNHVHCQTVRRCLRTFDMEFKEAKKLIVLSPSHKQRRLMLAEHWISSNFEWTRVVFSDEKRFSLDGPDGWSSWVPKGHFLCRNRRQQGGGNVQVWGMLLPNGKVFVEKLDFRSNSSDYIRLLDERVKPILEHEMPDGLIFQQDNASIHASRESMQWLNSNGLPPMEWPSRSPDLNPMENIWSMLSFIVYDGPQYKNREDLWSAIVMAVSEINEKKQPEVQNILNSMQARLLQVIQRNGDKTDY